MNKLEEIHVKPFDVINSFSPYDTNRECKTAKDNTLMAQKSVEITTDVAVKFAEWLIVKQYTKFAIYENQISQQTYKYSRWDESYKNPHEIIESETKSTEELFNEFINNHYGK